MFTTERYETLVELTLAELAKAQEQGLEAFVFLDDNEGTVGNAITEKTGLRCYYDNGKPFPGDNHGQRARFEAKACGFKWAQYYFVILDKDLEKRWHESRR